MLLLLIPINNTGKAIILILSISVYMQSEKAESLLKENNDEAQIEGDTTGENTISSTLEKCNANVKRKTWVISYVTQIVQSLEDICYNVALSQESSDDERQVTISWPSMKLTSCTMSDLLTIYN